MCFLQIHAQCYDRFFEVFPDEVENAELTVENAMSHVLLGLFDEGTVDDVTIRFSSNLHMGLQHCSIQIEAQCFCQSFRMPPLTFTPCSEWVQKLTTIHPDDLLPPEREALEEHMKSCSACAACRADYYVLRDDLRTSSVLGAPTDLPPRLLQLWEIEERDGSLDERMSFQDHPSVLKEQEFPMDAHNPATLSFKERMQLAVEQSIYPLLKELFGSVDVGSVSISGCSAQEYDMPARSVG